MDSTERQVSQAPQESQGPTVLLLTPVLQDAQAPQGALEPLDKQVTPVRWGPQVLEALWGTLEQREQPAWDRLDPPALQEIKV